MDQLTIKKYTNFVGIANGQYKGFARIYVLAAEIASVFAVDTSVFEANTELTSVFTADVTAVISKEILLSTTLIYESSPTYTSVSFFAGTYILFGLFWNSNTKYKSPTAAPS